MIYGRLLLKEYKGLLPTPVAQEGPGMTQMKLTDFIDIIGGTQPKYYQGKHKLTSSLEGFHVNHSLVPDSEKERQMTVTSGRKCSELLQNSGPLGLLAKMLMESSAWHSNIVTLTWKAKPILKKRKISQMEQMGLFGELLKVSKQLDMKSNYLLFQLAVSMPRTEEIGCGLLPTVTGQEVEHPKAKLTETGRRLSKNNSSHSLNIADRIAMLPTPKAGNDYGDTKMSPSSAAGKHGKSIAGVLSMLPTPSTMDYIS